MKKIALLTVFVAMLSSVYAQLPKPEMVLVEGGSYKMGNEESVHYDEHPDHSVKVSSFYMGKYEIMVGEYAPFCAVTGKQAPKGDDDFPAHNLSWQDAVMYCNWLSSVNGYDRCYEITRDPKNFRIKFLPEANGFRLPTEAEWEYAARGGNKTRYYSYSGSEDPNEIAWYMYSGHAIKPVGQKKPNELGIYDMSGNVFELCWDFYDSEYYAKSPEDNPTGPNYGSMRVARGGSYIGSEETLRVTKRFPFTPDHNDKTLGLRVVRNAE